MHGEIKRGTKIICYLKEDQSEFLEDAEVRVSSAGEQMRSSGDGEDASPALLPIAIPPSLRCGPNALRLCVGTACCAGATLEGPGEEALRVHRLPHRAVRGEVQGEGGDRHFAAQPLPEVTSRDALPSISRSPQARGFAPAHEPGALPRTPRRKRRRRRKRKRVPAGGGGRGGKAGTGLEVAGCARLV